MKNSLFSTGLICLATLSMPAWSPAAQRPFEPALHGHGLILKGRYAEAEKILLEEIARRPHDVYALNSLGLCLVKLERPTDASRAFREALRLDPANWFARQWLRQLAGRRQQPALNAHVRKPLNPEDKTRTSIHRQHIENVIAYAASVHGVDRNLVRAVARAESNFDHLAVSSKQAKGVMQLMDETAADLGVSDSFDPYQNIMGGTRYLRMLLDRYGGNVERALAAYNWGMGNLERNPGRLPGETRTYISRVMRFYNSAHG